MLQEHLITCSIGERQGEEKEGDREIDGERVTQCIAAQPSMPVGTSTSKIVSRWFDLSVSSAG